MRHWILMFRPETYAVAQEHNTIGVLHQHRGRFASLAPGDRFVTYISRKRVLAGHGEVTSQPYLDTTPIGTGWAHYPQRCGVRFDLVDGDVDSKELLWGLSACDENLKTTPANLLFCKGGFMEITEADYRWLRGVLDGDVEPHGAIAPADG